MMIGAAMASLIGTVYTKRPALRFASNTPSFLQTPMYEREYMSEILGRATFS
jgi:hypothetical protein